MVSYFLFPFLLIFTSCHSSNTASITIRNIYRKVLISNHTYSLETREDPPKYVLASLIIGNNSHSLPTFLRTLESLESKNCYIWAVFDKSTDESKEIFMYWQQNAKHEFSHVKIVNTHNNDSETRSQEHVSFVLWNFSQERTESH